MLVLVFFVFNSQIPKFLHKYYDKQFVAAQSVISSSDEFELLVRNGVYHLILNEQWSNLSILQKISKEKSVLDYCSSKPIPVLGYGEFGLLMHYAFLYAKNNSDEELIRLIQGKFDEYFFDSDFRIVRQDQMTYGNVAIDLYLHTSDARYKCIADEFFCYLDSIDKAKGIILYRENSNEQHVDAIGLVCPFLSYYSQSFNCVRAGSMAERMAIDFIRWGSDVNTGIPTQTYDLNSHTKIGHINWGRGTAWYILGTRDLQSSDSMAMQRLVILDDYLLQNKSLLWPKYLQQSGDPDMSATIPFLFHLIDKGKLKMSKEEYVNLISPYFDKFGVIKYCSPTISKPHEPVSKFVTSLCFEGLTLYTLSLLQ